jgi:hypothetical protein
MPIIYPLEIRQECLNFDHEHNSIGSGDDMSAWNALCSLTLDCADFLQAPGRAWYPQICWCLETRRQAEDSNRDSQARHPGGFDAPAASTPLAAYTRGKNVLVQRSMSQIFTVPKSLSSVQRRARCTAQRTGIQVCGGVCALTATPCEHDRDWRKSARSDC